MTDAVRFYARPSLNVEAYVLNAFNDYYYNVATRDVNFPAAVAGDALNNVFYVNPPDKRRFGLRVSYRWGGE